MKKTIVIISGVLAFLAALSAMFAVFDYKKIHKKYVKANIRDY